MRTINNLTRILLILSVFACSETNKKSHDQNIEQKINSKYNVSLEPYYSDNGFIEFIILEGHRISEIPYEITKLDSLNHLRIDRLNISQLPEWISSLKALKYLYLIYVPLNEYPTFLDKNKKIEELCIAGSEINKLPDIINFPELKVLRLEESPFIALPLIKRNENQEALSLFIKKTDITEIPSEYNTYSIKKIYIDDNRKLDHMDNLFGTYDSLKEVNIGYRGHTKFPMESFKKCYNLEVLSLTDQGLW
ncbi:leucine-rich repeat domain-containing protein, partial [Flammeovirga sp. SJP92]|uniref:leucine-rich repeat domain-containing protein n=1 Tax=Flammeovirga sp. SJP92 TaxID=1775430 RepID=UPI0009ED79FB